MWNCAGGRTRSPADIEASYRAVAAAENMNLMKFTGCVYKSSFCRTVASDHAHHSSGHHSHYFRYNERVASRSRKSGEWTPGDVFDSGWIIWRCSRSVQDTPSTPCGDRRSRICTAFVHWNSSNSPKITDDKKPITRTDKPDGYSICCCGRSRQTRPDPLAM